MVDIEPISVSFEDANGQESVALFSVIGKELLDLAMAFVCDDYFDKSANSIMFMFCHYLMENEWADWDFYLGKDYLDGDNSMHGHYKVNVMNRTYINISS